MFSNKTYQYGGGDIESGGLFPGISGEDQMLRTGFIRKVYGIVAAQLTLTALVAISMMSIRPLQEAVQGSMVVVIGSMVASFALLIPLYCYRQRHPLNLGLLAGWTLALSVSVGLACCQYPVAAVAEALVLTAGIVAGLTAYTFHATREGKDFTPWGPALFASLWGLVLFGFIQMVFPMGPLGQTVYSLIGALVFSLYIVFDTFLIVARFSIDEYVWASVNLYLDIINLFLRILEILGRRD
ncbi:unnamed protein product [Pedinophyceae sp. YPF-701]|nr:unnamed protein product [Pedinophyceae sp. YPF-701]